MRDFEFKFVNKNVNWLRLYSDSYVSRRFLCIPKWLQKCFICVFFYLNVLFLGDEAMQRLLACKGKDPYSILGLKSTALDDEIKKYYRKQAVLVHPDKVSTVDSQKFEMLLKFEIVCRSKRMSFNFHFSFYENIQNAEL